MIQIEWCNLVVVFVRGLTEWSDSWLALCRAGTNSSLDIGKTDRRLKLKLVLICRNWGTSLCVCGGEEQTFDWYEMHAKWARDGTSSGRKWFWFWDGQIFLFGYETNWLGCYCVRFCGSSCLNMCHLVNNHNGTSFVCITGKWRHQWHQKKRKKMLTGNKQQKWSWLPHSVVL